MILTHMKVLDNILKFRNSKSLSNIFKILDFQKVSPLHLAKSSFLGGI